MGILMGDEDLKNFDFDRSVNELGQTYVEFLLAELRRMATFVYIRHSREKDFLISINELLDKIKRMEDNGGVDPDPRKGNY
jgi:hypothetical protein